MSRSAKAAIALKQPFVSADGSSIGSSNSERRCVFTITTTEDEVKGQVSQQMKKDALLKTVEATDTIFHHPCK